VPTDLSPTPTRYDGSPVSTLVDGDPVNRDNLYVEASPGAKPKLTMGALLAWVHGITTDAALIADLASNAIGKGASMIKIRGGTDGTVWSVDPEQDLESFIGWMSNHLADLAFLADTTTPGKGLRAIGIKAFSGEIWDIAAGPAEDFLQALANAAWRVDKDIPSAPGRTSGVIGAAATSATIDATKPLWEQHFTGAAGSTINITVSDYAGTDPANPEIEIVLSTLNQTGSNPQWNIKRAGGTVIAQINTNAAGGANHAYCVSMRLRWNGSAWVAVSTSTPGSTVFSFAGALAT
jgi:hypothetical protein